MLQTSTPELALSDTQTEVLALSLRPEEFRTSIDDAVNLRRLTLREIGDYRNSRYVCSVWDRENERISDSPFDRGRKVITFNNILKYNTFPLAEIISDILRMGAEEMRCPVEVEFAVNMDVAPGQQQIFNLLQIRPIIDNQDNRAIDWSKEDPARALNLRRTGPRHRHDGRPRGHHLHQERRLRFALDRKDRRRTAPAEQPQCVTKDAPTSSSDRAAGDHRIPIWAFPSSGTTSPRRRSSSSAASRSSRSSPRRGTHFFQNVTSLGVGYLTISPFRGDGIFREEELNARKALYEGVYLRQVRFEHPLWVCIDGRSSKGMVREAQKD